MTPAEIFKEMPASLNPEAAKGNSKVDYGIPSYLPDGYTYVESSAPSTGRSGGDKIRLEKESLRDELIEAKRMAVEMGASLGLLESYYVAVRQDLDVDQAGANETLIPVLRRSTGSSDEGQLVGLRGNLSLLYQLCLQEAGLESRVVQGEVRQSSEAERHAWNLVWLAGAVMLVNVTLAASGGEPFILLGTSVEDVYREAHSHQRGYRPTTEARNH